MMTQQESNSTELKRLASLRAIALCGPLLLMLVLSCTPGISFTEDLGRHLLLGRVITETHSVPDTNLLTYTHPDFPFVNHHWLSEVIFHQMHRAIGYNGLIALKMLLMTGALALALFSVRRPRHILLLWFAGILAAVMLSFRSHIRPELFTFVGVAFLGYGFERIRKGARWPWFAAILYMWFWSNAQIYFIFGLFMCAAFALEVYFHRPGTSPFSVPRSPSDVRRSAFGVQRSASPILSLFLWLAALTAVCALNPNGVAALLYPFRIFSNYEVGITENASVLEYWRSVINPMMLALPFASVLALWAAWTNRKTRPANSAIVLAALAATWMMARSVPLLALTLVPAVAGAESRRNGVLEHWSAGKKRILTTLQYSITPILLASLNILIIFSVLSGAFYRPFPSPIGPSPFGFDDESRYLQVRELKEQGLPGPVFTDYNLGSLVEYNLWPEPGYVDNRPEAFPGAFWRTEYTPALALGPAWEIIRERRGINTIAVSLAGVKEGYAQTLMQRPDWILVDVDSIQGVWVYNSPQNRAFLEQNAFTAERLRAYDASIQARLDALDSLPFWKRQTAADQLVYDCYSLLCIGEPAKAWPHIRRLHERYPDYQIVHELMRVTCPPEEVPAVTALIEKKAQWPVSAKQVLDWGRVLESEGRWNDAMTAYRRGLLFFPLSDALQTAVSAVEDETYRQRSEMSQP